MNPKLPNTQLYFGEDRAPQTELVLRAGPLRLLFHNGLFRYMRLGNQEIIRTLYLAVRDRNWRTVPWKLMDLESDIGAESFQLSYGLLHRQRDIDFRWRVSVSGGPDGSILCSADGESHTRFLANRIGICVLHPIVECAGKSCVITHSDGIQEHAKFPRDVAPHQPFLDVREMCYAVNSAFNARILFNGDEFETEDQRNWTDASFKTYSTPLSRPHPIEIPPGARRSQSVSLEIIGDLSSTISPDASSDTITLAIRAERRTRLPRIGFKDAALTAKLTDATQRRLRNLGMEHLSVDVRFGDAESEESLWRSSQRAKQLNLPLEVVIADDSDITQAGRIAVELKCREVDVCRWLARGHTPSKEQVDAMIQLETVAPVAIGGGANFAELNRNRPTRVMAGGVWFSANPQMHGTDDATLIENLAAQADVIRSLRSWAGRAPISVCPVTLKPPSEPVALASAIPDSNTSEADDSDPRQTSLLGAAWTLGSIKHLAEEGATTVTYFETFGSKGLMPFPSIADMVYPMYHVFVDVLELKNAEVLRIESSEPLIVEGLALLKENRLRIMVASFVARPIRIEIALDLPIGKAEWRRIDEVNAEIATRDPEGHRSRAEVVAVDRSLRIELKPFSVATINATMLNQPRKSDVLPNGRPQ